MKLFNSFEEYLRVVLDATYFVLQFVAVVIPVLLLLGGVAVLLAWLASSLS